MDDNFDWCSSCGWVLPGHSHFAELTTVTDDVTVPAISHVTLADHERVVRERDARIVELDRDKANLFASWNTERNEHDEEVTALSGEITQLRGEIAQLRAELAEAKTSYGNACKLVADMHAAAVGEVRGPKRGVVEDVEDLRAELAERICEKHRDVSASGCLNECFVCETMEHNTQLGEARAELAAERAKSEGDAVRMVVAIMRALALRRIEIPKALLLDDGGFVLERYELIDPPSIEFRMRAEDAP